MDVIGNRNFSNEFVFCTSRSGGPGGQNVNKVNTKVELRFSIPNSILLSEIEKQVLLDKLASKLTLEDELIIVSQSERSQLGNKDKCVEKFYLIISKSLKPRKKRIASKPTRASKEKRIEGKKIQAKKKDLRKPPLG